MMDPSLPLTVTLEVRDRCLCLHVQRAARVLARRFDDALRPFGVTNGQFSLLMSLNLADLLGMDRTTLTAALKPLERKGLVTAQADKADRRARRLHLTDAGRSVLAQALPTWRATHDAVDAALAPATPQDLRDGLTALAGA